MKKSPNIQAPESIWRKPQHFIASGFGFGAVPFAPGTWTTLAAIPIYFMLCRLPLALYLLVTVAMIIVGVFVCGAFNRDLNTDDHPSASWDEMAGFMVVMIAIPPTWYYVTLGFLLFRLFDIWKPGPIAWIDRHCHGGWGVMLDDVVAALFAWVILLVLHSVVAG